MPVYRTWSDFFFDKIVNKLDSSLSGASVVRLKSIFFNRIMLVSFSVITEYVNNFLKEQNPLFFLAPELIPKKMLDEYVTNAAKELNVCGINTFDEYPELIIRINRCCDQFVLFINEMTQRINFHRAEISDKLLDGKMFNKIVGFDGNGADIHNNGQSTIVVETDSGKFVYKPHDCTMDIFFGQICHQYFDDIIKVPNILYICKDYSFVEFINNDPANTYEDAAKYYSNLGGLCSLLTFLCGSDFHKDNIMAIGSSLFPIDLETACMSIIPSDYKSTATEDFRRSAIKTSMFSINSVEKNTKEFSPLFDMSDNNISAPMVNGKRLSAIGFRKEFKDGYINVYKHCLSIKDKLLKLVTQMPDLRIRILLIDTNYYSNIINTLNSCRYLKNRDDAFFVDKLKREYPAKIAEKELKSMLNSDIPYFYLKPFSKALYSGDDVILENFLCTTPFENLKKNMLLRCERELAFESQLIDKLFANAITEENRPNAVIFQTSDPYERAIIIFKIIKDSFFESPSGKLCLVESSGGNYPGLVGIDFKKGNAGIALFCAALYFLSDKHPQIQKESFELCNRLIAEVSDEIDSILENDIYHQVQSNDLGIKKALNLISKYTSQSFENTPIRHKLSSCPSMSLKNNMKYDSAPVYKDSLFDGNAGIADSLMERYIETSNPLYYNCAEKLLLTKQTYNFIPEGYPSLFCSGFMGGASGLGYELLRLINPKHIESVYDY